MAERDIVERLMDDNYRGPLQHCRDWAEMDQSYVVAAAEILRLRAELAETKADKDGAYEERNKVVALLARLFPSGLKKTNIPGWNPEWHGCVYIDLPTGQVSWHYHESQAHLFDSIQPYNGEWDGHDTPEKYRRVAELTDRSSISRAALAVMPDQYRAGWTACRDAAADIKIGIHGSGVPNEPADWAMGVEDALHAIRKAIRNMEPPA